MKLCEEVKSVLDLACPVWMQKLCAVNFDLESLENYNDRHNLRSEYRFCFIGEIHNNDSSYRWGQSSNFCSKCRDFAQDVVLIFTNRRSEEQRVQLLKKIADHVKEKHPELMNKKSLENDC